MPATLRLGSQGQEVETLQRLLNQKINAGLRVDGDFGPRTDAAVRRFQQLQRLTVDGVVGPNTWASLQRGSSPSSPPPPSRPNNPSSPAPPNSPSSPAGGGQTPGFTGRYREVFRQTPNCRNTGNRLLGCVLHHSAGSYTGSVNWILNDDSDVSYHVIIDTDGSRTAFARDEAVCWHAGRSSWKGRSRCNSFTVGLAWSGDTYRRSLSNSEIESAIDWLLPRMRRHNWTIDDITTHREVSPGRKNDPSPEATRAFLDALRRYL